jgi:hypothetical protein
MNEYQFYCLQIDNLKKNFLRYGLEEENICKVWKSISSICLYSRDSCMSRVDGVVKSLHLLRYSDWSGVQHTTCMLQRLTKLYVLYGSPGDIDEVNRIMANKRGFISG